MNEWKQLQGVTEKFENVIIIPNWRRKYNKQASFSQVSFLKNESLNTKVNNIKGNAIAVNRQTVHMIGGEKLNLEQKSGLVGPIPSIFAFRKEIFSREYFFRMHSWMPIPYCLLCIIACNPFEFQPVLLTNPARSASSDVLPFDINFYIYTIFQ